MALEEVLHNILEPEEIRIRGLVDRMAQDGSQWDLKLLLVFILLKIDN